ncbi:FAD-dependent monooxygenase [Pseudonocardia humida]|uniref:FAD-dependent monooxygenase n=1 Tax=Pseudonocardia humida TaxID=2800819 RepID=A0ABT0ZUN7_9PSEU|nr:FAD-dependent monooxygenase [Pseudonocardia humida]MCO1654433.1 FAD-dependent monooxygenase [Pseudonocardia humida]
MAEVVVVGAGPTGLLVAGDLAARGVAVSVLEARPGPSELARAFVLHARTLEVLDARGMADALVERGARTGELRLPGRSTIVLDDLASRFPYMLLLPQAETERALAERASACGADIRYGAPVSTVRAEGDVVETAIEGGPTVRSQYVVGADGVGSVVRRSVGASFPGRTVIDSVMLADVRLSGEAPHSPVMNAVEEGFAFLSPLGDGWHRVVAWRRGERRSDDEPVDMEEVRTLTRAALGTDYGMHASRWTSRFHSAERQVPRYRHGAVFLAGDAAHVHSPVLGQGLNTGIQDAANLGWKLAAAVRGRAAPGVLDSYHDERHPVGRQVLRSSGAVLRMALVRSPVLRGLRDLSTTAMRLAPIRRSANAMISGIGVRYPRPPHAHRSVGARAADCRLRPGPGRPTRLYEALRTGRFVLVTDGAVPPGLPDDVEVAAPAGASPVPAVLVRPDGYLAWAGAAADPGATRALATWIRS